MTIVESLTWANNKLKDESSVDAPMLDAQLLLAFVLDVSKNYLFTHFGQELTDDQMKRFESLMDRRRHHEPLAYILGWKEFYSRPFRVNSFVLIPRPDTEVLIEEAKKLVEGAQDTLFIDVGTGSGAIAVTLAAETKLPVIAVDLSPQALTLAEQNAKIHKVADRVTFLQSNLLKSLKPEVTRGLQEVIITANLPYLTTKQIALAESEVKDYEPRLALDGGVDGLDVYNELFRMLSGRRADFPKALTVLIEIDPGQHISAPHLILEYFPKAETRVVQDLANKPRVVISQL
ncbi:MAG: peptide chain release factor N(5)-glutamine methyltransferase [Patescibacteria group bacterium]